MDRTLKENLREDFTQILRRKDFKNKIDAQNLDVKLLSDAFDILIDDLDNEQQFTAFQNKIINSLKSKSST